MRLAALIEITSTADGQLPVDLIGLAYRTSANAPVVLVLADDLRDRVERILDPLVAQLPLRIPGVRYVSDTDLAAVSLYARAAERVVLGESLRARVLASGEAAASSLPVVAGHLPPEWRSGASLPGLARTSAA